MEVPVIKKEKLFIGHCGENETTTRGTLTGLRYASFMENVHYIKVSSPWRLKFIFARFERY